MSAPQRSYKASGIVLRARNLGEADKIFTIFTLEWGKIDAVAKGVRRPKSQLAGRLEFVTEATLSLHRGRSLDVITSAEIACEHWHAIVEPGAFATAHLVVELVDLFSERDFAMPEVYDLLRGGLRALSTSDDPAALVPRFQLRLLGTLGFAPECDACVRCGTPFDDVAAWADIEAGGLACERCRPHRADALALSATDVANFRGLAARYASSVKPATRATAPAARAVDAFVTWQLGKRTKAGRMLDELTTRKTMA
ncbi:MAG: DNA repair protein RecO [Vulcanimicrobiaceae bacterium]